MKLVIEGLSNTESRKRKIKRRTINSTDRTNLLGTMSSNFRTGIGIPHGTALYVNRKINY